PVQFGFTDKIRDGTAGSAPSASVTVPVAAVNDAPAAVDDSANTSEDTAVDIDVVANDTDLDNPNADLHVAVSSILGVHGGTAVLQPDGRTVRFTPTGNANDGNTPGGFGFTYKPSESTVTSNAATASIA